MNAARQQNGKAVGKLAARGVAAAARLTISYLESRSRARTGQPSETAEAIPPSAPAAGQDRHRATVSPTPDPAVTAALRASQQAQAYSWASRVYGSW